MQNKPTTANALTGDQRQQLEADFTFKLLVELELVPVVADRYQR
jgi:cell filamentation protein